MDTVLRRERLIISGCLAAVVVLSWLYLVHTKTAMAGMDMPGMVMVDFQRWGPTTVLLLFVMWTVMMVAMMVPSAAPMILAFVTVNQRRQAANKPFVPVTIFLFGYLAVWTAFSAVATLAEWGLHQAAMLSTTMTATSTALNGGLLIAAGTIPVDTDEARVPEGLPVTALLSYERVARRRGGRFRHGIAAWRVLRGMLLVSDGPAICGRRYESFVGRGNCALRPGRED